MEAIVDAITNSELELEGANEMVDEKAYSLIWNVKLFVSKARKSLKATTGLPDFTLKQIDDVVYIVTSSLEEWENEQTELQAKLCTLRKSLESRIERTALQVKSAAHR